MLLSQTEFLANVANCLCLENWKFVRWVHSMNDLRTNICSMKCQSRILNSLDGRYHSIQCTEQRKIDSYGTFTERLLPLGLKNSNDHIERLC